MLRFGFSVFDWQAVSDFLYFIEKGFLTMRAMDSASGKERCLGEKPFLPFRVFRAGLFSDLSAWDSYPLRILDFVELRVPPLISHEKTVPSRQSLQKGLLPRAAS